MTRGASSWPLLLSNVTKNLNDLELIFLSNSLLKIKHSPYQFMRFTRFTSQFTSITILLVHIIHYIFKSISKDVTLMFNRHTGTKIEYISLIPVESYMAEH